MPMLTPDFLANIPIFRGTSEEERAQLLQAMERRTFEKGELTTERALHVIVEGSAEVILEVHGFENPLLEEIEPSHVVDRAQVAVLEVGQTFGELSFFVDGDAHSARVRALEHLETLALPPDRFEEMLAHRSEAAYKIGLNGARILAVRLRSADRLIEELVLAQTDAVARARWQEVHALYE